MEYLYLIKREQVQQLKNLIYIKADSGSIHSATLDDILVFNVHRIAHTLTLSAAANKIPRGRRYRYQESTGFFHFFLKNTTWLLAHYR
jgi:hypothetical protein